MLIILDCGANDGCSIKKFRKIFEERNIVDYMIYSFEPIKFFNRYLDPLIDEKTVIINKIISTDDEPKKLYLSQEDGAGSSVLSTKISNGISEDKFIVCESINIVKFIDELPDHDELWIKMDIEGAEYDIIEHMYKHGCIKKISKLFIEWHYKKLSNISFEKHKQVYNMVKHLPMETWSALRFSNSRTKKTRAYKKWITKQ